MRIFAKPNLSRPWSCPVCKKADEKAVVLVGIAGSSDGNLFEAEQVHVDCLFLLYYKDKGIIAMVIE